MELPWQLAPGMYRYAQQLFPSGSGLGGGSRGSPSAADAPPEGSSSGSLQKGLSRIQSVVLYKFILDLLAAYPETVLKAKIAGLVRTVMEQEDFYVHKKNF